MRDLFGNESSPAEPGDDPGSGREKSAAAHRVPLAERMRPRTWSEFRGQAHLLGPEGALRAILEQGELTSSLILWGPPGSGKTTLARLIAAAIRADFHSFSAVTAGIREVKAVVERAHELRRIGRGPVLLFVDEVHRFNKAQQDAFLPHIEAGTLVLVGATTENPSFAINAALRSRSRVFELQPLETTDIVAVLEAALADSEHGLGGLDLDLEPGVLHRLAELANGDARAALQALEFATAGFRPGTRRRLTADGLRAAMAHRIPGLDRGGEEHYNLVSALHKSLRGSDPDASLYWLARLLEAGEDPMYVGRRLVRVASEDVGNADPRALQICIAALQAVERIGMPEADLALAQAALYLATAPKSNRVARAYDRARAEVRDGIDAPVPMHLRNAPTAWLGAMGRAEGYLYPHDFEAGLVIQDYLPAPLAGRMYYEPSDAGYEKTLSERLQSWREFRLHLKQSGRVGLPKPPPEFEKAPGDRRPAPDAPGSGPQSG